ncbi:hypothetical protein VP1G_11313 [Cytospora mali]|uniref:Uncharacterized protein n=1 Tax=Cytospora mali TaxID=578113 RepID=A0A194VEI8_CYTMA|nr:hypothetical protein VP1G_11313 [Valsa mali var. pyri (nom. inval.)]
MTVHNTRLERQQVTAPTIPLPDDSSTRSRPSSRRHSPIGSTRAHPALQPRLRGHHKRLIHTDRHTPRRTTTRTTATTSSSSAPKVLLAPLPQEGLHPHTVPGIRLDDGSQDIPRDGHQLDDKVDERPDDHGHQHGRGQAAAAHAARGADQRERVGEGDEVAHDGEQPPDRGGPELHVQPAAAVAVDPPLVAPGLAADGLEDPLVLLV